MVPCSWDGRHDLARHVFHGRRGDLRRGYHEGMEDQIGALGLALNCITMWNTVYLDHAPTRLRADLEIQDETGRRLARRKLPEGIAGIGQLHALLAEHLPVDAEPDQVVVGIETDRGPWVQALLAAGYQVYAINPLSASRYRERHVTSGAKSDPGDAKVLADLVRTDRQHHRPIAGDSELAETVAVT